MTQAAGGQRTRRAWVRVGCAVWLALAAGCGDGSSGATRTPTALAPTATATAPMSTRTPTSSATATASPTETATATLTATPTATPSSTATGTATPETLRGLADRAGTHVGAAFVEGSQEAEFRTVLAREFNSTTVGLYWSSSQPAPDRFEFAGSDAVLELAEANRQRVRGHPLVWGRLALPQYVNDMTDPEALRALMAEHVQTIVSRYRGRIAQYDVVNEPLTLFGDPGVTGTGLENYVFLRLLGPGYIREALELARAADPDAKLFVNELFVEAPGAKQDQFFELVRGLVEAGAPLDGVGFQGHITPPFNPTFAPTREQVSAAVQRFAALGLAVEITELDVTLTDPATQIEPQGETYRDIFAACYLTAGCTGITTWGITDRFSWIEAFFRVMGAPLPFDAEYQPKPAYFAARDVLRTAVTAASIDE